MFHQAPAVLHESVFTKGSMSLCHFLVLVRINIQYYILCGKHRATIVLNLQNLFENTQHLCAPLKTCMFFGEYKKNHKMFDKTTAVKHDEFLISVVIVLIFFRLSPTWVKRWSWSSKTSKTPRRRNIWTMARTLVLLTMTSSSCIQ